MMHVFIMLNSKPEPFIETVSNYMFDEKGNLNLYNKEKYWFLPYTNLQYVYIEEIKE